MFDFVSVHPRDLWYLIGLITSDGSLSKDGRHIDLTSKDVNHLENIKTSLGISNKLGRKFGGAGKEVSFNIQIGNKKFYSLLLEIGLKPNKSLNLGALNVPKAHFHDFLRGIIDGDGNIQTWIHSSNKRRQWALRIYSASPAFASWLKSSIEDYFAVKGSMYVEERPGSHGPLHTIKFGKLPAKIVLRAYYYPGCLAMPRKLESAKRCIETPNGVKKYGKVIAGVAK